MFETGKIGDWKLRSLDGVGPSDRLWGDQGVAGSGECGVLSNLGRFEVGSRVEIGVRHDFGRREWAPVVELPDLVGDFLTGDFPRAEL